MRSKEKEKLPEVKEVTVKIGLNEASECLKYLPASLEVVRKEIEEGIKHAQFWNLARDCEHLEFQRADFHLTGLMTPAWHMYCKHPENKAGTGRLYIEDLRKEVRDKITGTCSKEDCPVCKR